MYAVFLFTENVNIPDISNEAVYVFDEESDAEKFVFEALVKSGEITVKDSRLWVDARPCENQEEAIEAVQDTFGITEFFHVFRAIDCRQTIDRGLKMLEQIKRHAILFQRVLEKTVTHEGTMNISLSALKTIEAACKAALDQTD